MPWGISETASEIEKIKAESADYLNGLNCTGVVDYKIYCEAFDFYANLLEKAYSIGFTAGQNNILEAQAE